MESLSKVDTSENSIIPDITKKRERNRTAANKNRRKHTERADALHQEYEALERDNASLRKEIKDLQQEVTRWSLILKEHEATCLLESPDIILDLLQSADPLWFTTDMAPLNPF